LIFRFSDIFGVSSNSVPALGLLDLAIRNRVFSESLRSFNEACEETLEVSQSSYRGLVEATAFRTKLLSLLGELMLDGGIEEFLERYFARLIGNVNEASSVSLATFSDDIVNFLESFLRLSHQGLPRKTLLSSNDHYRILLRHSSDALHGASICLSPIIYWLHHPFWPSNFADEIYRRIINVVELHGGPIEETSILVKLKADDLVVRRDFLNVVLSNETGIVRGKIEGRSVVWGLGSDEGRFKLGAFHLDESEFLDINQWYQLQIDDQPGYVVTSGIQVQKERLKHLFCSNFNTGEKCEVDWVDLGYKLACFKNESCESSCQGLGESLHSAIVEQLRMSGRAMRLVELQNILGIKFDLSPETLGPAIGNGKIMAYARHSHFLDRDHAYYVLSDLVETDTEKKGRILRNRIVTPWVQKDWEFSRSEFFKAVRADSVYSIAKIVILSRIASALTKLFPLLPSELYYQHKIIERAKNFLREVGFSIGKGAYIIADDFPVSLQKVAAKDNLADIRAALVWEAFGFPDNIRRTVLEISDEGVREEIFALI
jgi:hypothetical protein